MSRASSQYDFSLSRWQRLLTLLQEWWIGILIGVPSVFALLRLFPWNPVLAMILLLLLLFAFRGLVFGAIDLLRRNHRLIEIQEKGIGFGRKSTDLWIFTDGVRALRRNRWGTWTIKHHNGTYLDIPTSLMKQEDIDFLRNCIRKYEVYHGIRKTVAHT
jgi:hypothetical protein